MLKKIIKNIKTNNLKPKKQFVSNPYPGEFLQQMSKQVVKLYERQKDIEKFTKIALEQNNTPIEEELINNLLDKDIENLTENENFLRDLGIE